MRRSAITTSAVVALVGFAGAAHAQRAGQGEDEAATFVEVGRKALLRKDYDEAQKALEQARTLNSRRIEAYVLLSAVYAARKQYTKGVALMRQAQLLAPEDPEVLLALGSDLVLAGDAGSGVPLLQKVVAKEPARYDAQQLLGHYFHDSSRWPEAIVAYEAYFAHRPPALANEDAIHQIDLADSYLRGRRPKDALALFQKAALHGGRSELRARIGIAWATAAIDCKRARPILQELEPIADQHPEVWLVDGQCALSLGDTAGALAAGRRYLAGAPNASPGDRRLRAGGALADAATAAAGHALVGEADAARGDLNEARAELETARKLEPARRRWTVQLAMVLRRAGHAGEALDALEQLGAPATPPVDRDWWIELGEALLARGDAGPAASRLAPIASELPGDAAFRTVLGAAQLSAGQLDAAVKTLDEAEGIESTPRSRKLLAEALVRVAVGKLSGEGGAAVAEPMLVRAVELDPSPVALRDLGIARLALGKPADAVPVFERAIKTDAPPTVVMLAARAHALAGDIAAARPLYERALAGERDNPVEIALDWAASELAAGDPATAVTALEKVQAAAKSGPLAARHRTALATARHAAGLAALKAGNGGKAVELLRASLASDPVLATKCDLAVATVTAGDSAAALTALHAVTGATCPFPPPADTQAAPILTAFVEGLSARKASRALERLTALGGKATATGVVAALLGTAIRVVALDAAQDAYRAGDLGAARRYLAAAKAANARVGADEIAADLAVLDLADGHVDAAIGELDRLAAKVPEALVNLGIAYERKGDQGKALDAWRRARKMGVRFGGLDEWIGSKERIYGGER